MRAIPWASRFTFRLCTLVAVLIVSAEAARADMLVVSGHTHEILRYHQTTGAYLGVFASNVGMQFPVDLTYGPDGNLYVSSGSADFGQSVFRYDGQTGAFIDQFATGLPFYATGLSFGPNGDLYVAGSNSGSVSRVNGITGAIVNTVYAPGFIPLADDLIFGPDGKIYVAAQAANQVVRFDGTTGAMLDVFASGGGLSQTSGLAFGPDGNLYVGSYGTSSVLRYDGMTGAFIDTFASGGGLVGNELGLVFGPDGNLYVGGAGSGKVHRYDGATGAFIDVFTSGGAPQALGGIVFMPSTEAVPEPTSMALLGLASLGGLGLRLRQRRRAKTAP